MTTPSRELTPEQIAPALAEVRGIKYWEEDGSIWTREIEYLESPTATDTDYKVFAVEIAPFCDIQYNELTLDPEIHAGMIDVLDEWLSYNPDISTGGDNLAWDWQHSQKYLKDIRLWQLRAVVEFLRRRGK